MGTDSRQSAVKRLAGTIAALLCTAALASAQSVDTLNGRVLDESGASVADATVRVNIAGNVAGETQTDANGRFEVAVTAGGARDVVVTAPGFAPASASVAAGERTVDVTLQAAPFFEAVNVTSSRAEVARVDPTSTVTVISSTDLLNSGALAIDDALKAIPGFTLFRRTSSRNSNPTSQGVALRGIGGTSPSRSLVLADGVPLNDAFGGWVFWDKVPQAAIDRIEVDRGSGGDLYGADALGGVVQLLTVRPNRPVGRIMMEGGTLGTGSVSVFGGGRAGEWRYSGAGEWFNTDGYVAIAEQQNPGIAVRGPVDSNLGSTHRSAQLFAGYQTDTGWRFDLTGNVFSEDRDNGTPLSINSTASRHGAADITGRVAGGMFTMRGYGGTQQYHQTFTTVNALRTAEVFIRDQHVPTTFGGGGGQWVRAFGRHTLLAGGEGRYVKGQSVETPFVGGLPQVTTAAGGTDRRWSGFVQDTWQAGDRLTLVLGAHGDTWDSKSRLSGFTKSSQAFSPRAAAAYRVSDLLSVRGAVYHGFRAPTLNEFYRNFSAGNTLTRANEALGPERMTGGDAGVVIGNARASARVTGFWNSLDNAITAITLTSTPAQIVKLRSNADRLESKGVELEGNVRLAYGFAVNAAAGIASVHFTGNTTLRGKRVPQVPTYNTGAGVQYNGHAWTGSMQLRVTGPQFEDDQNVFTLRRATVVDIFGSRSLARWLNAFVAVENVFDSIYDVGRTPVLTTGLPRSARAGIRLFLP
jgi:outer membrane receptor protein involved in Fe transport